MQASAITHYIPHLGNKQQYKEALEIGKWGLQKYPDEFRLSNAIGYLHKDLGDVAATRSAFQNSLEVLERIKDDLEEKRYLNRKKLVEGWIKELTKNKDILILKKRFPPVALIRLIAPGLKTPSDNATGGSAVGGPPRSVRGERLHQ